MNIDLFGGKPLHTIGKSETALGTAKGAQGGAHTGISYGPFSQTQVVVGLGKMDGDPVTGRYLVGSRQIRFDLSSIIVLKQLRIRPVKIGPVQNITGY